MFGIKAPKFLLKYINVIFKTRIVFIDIHTYVCIYILNICEEILIFFVKYLRTCYPMRPYVPIGTRGHSSMLSYSRHLLPN